MSAAEDASRCPRCATPVLAGARFCHGCGHFLAAPQTSRTEERKALSVLVGAMLSPEFFTRDVIWFVPLLLLVIRPASVWAGLFGSHTDAQQRHYISWFGVRGIGSIYYLMYALNHGLPEKLAEPVIAVTLATVTVSIVVHGVSMTPLMAMYVRRKAARSK